MWKMVGRTSGADNGKSVAIAVGQVTVCRLSDHVNNGGEANSSFCNTEQAFCENSSYAVHVMQCKCAVPTGPCRDVQFPYEELIYGVQSKVYVCGCAYARFEVVPLGNPCLGVVVVYAVLQVAVQYRNAFVWELDENSPGNSVRQDVL